MTLLSKKLLGAIAVFTLLAGCDATQKYEQPLTINAPCFVHKNTFCIAKPHPTKPLIASASYDKTVKVWQQKTGDIVQTLPHPDGVPALAFSPNGKYLVTGSYDNVVRLWDLQSGTLLKSLNGHTQMVWGISFAPNGKSFASVGADDSIWLWDFKTGKGEKLGEHDGDTWGVTYSPDGKYVLSSGEDDLVKIWKVNDGQLANVLDAHSGAVLNIVFSHDGTMMASGGDDYTVKLWNTQNWQVTSTFSGDFYSVYGLAFSPDDKLLVSGGRDKGLFGEFLQYHFDYKSDENSVTMLMWDVEQKVLVKQFNGHSDDVNNIEFSRDGQFIISSGADGKVILWDAKTN